MSDVAVQITCTIDGEKKRIILDTIDDVQINLSSTITNHPIANGDIIADHMYNEPSTVNISGAFSLNGSNAFVVSQSGTSIINVQEMFEKIKNEGIMCSIVKLVVGTGKNGIRFKQRDNMVLTSITWTERINTTSFDFSFVQALVAEVQEYETSVDDAFLPNVTEPASMSFTEALIDWNQVDGMIIDIGLQLGLISEEFLDFMKGCGVDLLVGLGVGSAVALTVFLAVGSIPVAGWVVAGVAAAVVFVTGLYGSIKSMIESRKYRIDQFKRYKDDRKNQKEVQRFCEFVGNIHQQMQLLNDSIHCWQIASNEEQEAMITIDNNYYIFAFTKNNISNSYHLDVSDVNNVLIGSISDVASSPEAFTDCTTNNKIFRAAESGAYVYLIKASTGDASDLRSYFIVSTTLQPEKFNETLTEIIKNAVLR